MAAKFDEIIYRGHAISFRYYGVTGDCFYQISGPVVNITDRVTTMNPIRKVKTILNEELDGSL